MGTLTVQETELFRQEFQKELVRLHETKQSQSYWARMIMTQDKIKEIINHLKGICSLPPGKENSWVNSRQFRVMKKPSASGVSTEYLAEPFKEKIDGRASASKYLKVVPREDIFDTLLVVHLENNHSTLRETVHLVRKVVSNIPRYLIHKFILLCPVCSNNGATTNSVGLPYIPSRRCQIKARRRRKLMDQFQVDVLDLRGNPDGDYNYILHCMDHITGFHWLFPLAQIDPAEVAQNLVWGIFSLFGFPTELVSEYGENFATRIINEVIKLWPDELHIKNYLEGNSYKGDLSKRSHRNVTRFIDDMASKRAANGDNRLKWSEWLPEIQFLMNATVVDVRSGKTPYEKVFRTQPITPVPKTKFVGGKVETVDSSNAFNIQGESDLSQEEITEEIVGDGDMAVMHHDMQFDGVGSGMVVVDVGGVEHSIQTQDHQLLQNVQANLVEGVEANLMESDLHFEAIASNQISSHAMSEVSDIHSVVQTEAMHQDTEKWVTLTHDTGNIEVHGIQPTLEDVKFAPTHSMSNIAKIESTPSKSEILETDMPPINIQVSSKDENSSSVFRPRRTSRGESKEPMSPNKGSASKTSTRAVRTRILQKSSDGPKPKKKKAKKEVVEEVEIDFDLDDNSSDFIGFGDEEQQGVISDDQMES